MTAQRLQLTWYNKDKALIPTKTGKYDYTWVDPSDPRYCETHTLIMDEYVRGRQTEKSDKFEYSDRADLDPQDDNLLILGESGDVLEALTRVPELTEKYVGKVKLIYIDPPFNTAKTFADYEDNLEHSVWLTMMRDRLLHMKQLLSDDGSIWVHLDDMEVHRMRVLMDEVFGADRFLSSLNVEINPKGRQLGDGLARTDDTILGYCKDPLRLSWNTGTTDTVDMKDFPLRDAQGIPYRLLPLRNTNKRFRPNNIPTLSYPLYVDTKSGNVSTEPITSKYVPVYPVFGDGTQAVWRWSIQKAEAQISELFGREVAGHLGLRVDVFQKDYAREGRTKKLRTRWNAGEIGSSDTAKAEITDLFPNDTPFSTPKPERLLERIIHIGSNPGDIVLDVFAGSGTTAAVAQKMGRRWVTCELVEDTFNRFTRPRLEKVINDEDPGGITRTKGERVAADGVELPEGVSPDDAAKFTSVLNKLITDDPEAKKNPLTKALKAASKTRRSKAVVNWRGGGGFQVAHLSPACFDYDPELDRVMLTAAATGQTLVESVAANLGFTLLDGEEDYVFDGRRGNALLKVVEGVATPEIVDWLSSLVQPGETIVLAATSVMDGVREQLRKAVKGSRVVSVPDDVFRYAQGGGQ